MSNAEKFDNPELESAQKMVDQSMARFESSLEKLEARVLHSRERVQRVVDTAKRPVHLAQNYANQAKAYGNQIITKAQQNPKPFVYGAAAVLAGIMVISYFGRRRT